MDQMIVDIEQKQKVRNKIMKFYKISEEDSNNLINAINELNNSEM